jgi:hypothetical protein
MTKIGTMFQQDISLLTGEERTRPMNPTHRRDRGAVRIGNRPILFTRPIRITEEEMQIVDAVLLHQTLAAKRRSTLHECISMEMGEPCPHIFE